MRPLALALMLVLAVCLLASGSARAAGGGLPQGTPVPPSNPAENQYVEDFPGAGGPSSLSSLIDSHHRHSKLPASLRRALRETFGASGRALANLLAALWSGGARSGGGAPIALAAGTPPTLAAARSLFGTGGALGVLLPIVLGAIALLLAALALARRRHIQLP